MRRQKADTATGTRRGDHHISPRLRSWLYLGGGTLVFLLLFLLPDLIAPARAQAFNPVDALGDGFDFLNPANLAKDAIEKAGTEAAGAIKDAFYWMLNQIFGGIQATLSVKLLGWLTTLPDFSGGQVMQIQRAIQIGAGACLGCVLTISIVRFWLGSYTSGSGVSAGLEGLIRTAIAALLIGLWPKIFSIGVGFSNAFSNMLLNDAARERLENLFQGLDMASLGLPAAGGATAGAIGLFIGAGISALVWIVISTASVVLFLGLIIMKIIVTSGTVIAFVAMPLALVLWPIPETSWIANMLAKALAVLLAIPVIWVLIFGAASAVGADVFFLSNNGKNDNFLQTGLNILLIKPLVACALLYLAVMLPSRLVRMAPLMGGGRMPGSRVASAVTSYATYRGLEKVSAGAGTAISGARNGINPPAQQSMGGAGFERPGFKGKIYDKASEMGEKVRSRAAQETGRATGAAATTAAGTAAGAAAGPAGAAAGGAAGAAIGQKAAAAAPGTTAPAGGRADIPISHYEGAPQAMKGGHGGPAVVGGSGERSAKVDAEHQRMNTMSADQRPTPAQTQQAWDKLGASPQAQNAVRSASASSDDGSTPRELADWSTNTNNPRWGTDAENATRTIGEASPSVRENVVTEGKGYWGEGTFGGGGGATNNPGAGGASNGNGGGNGTTPRPQNTTKNVTNPTAGKPRQAMRQGES